MDSYSFPIIKLGGLRLDIIKAICLFLHREGSKDKELY